VPRVLSFFTAFIFTGILKMQYNNRFTLTKLQWQVFSIKFKESSRVSERPFR